MSIINNQDEIHKMAQSNVVDECLEAAKFFKENFKSLNNKEQAWQDMIQLMQNNDFEVRKIVSESLLPAFHFTDKVYAWEKLMKYMEKMNKQHIDYFVLSYVIEVLGHGFRFLPSNSKKKAWQDLIQLSKDMNNNVRNHVYITFYLAFKYVPDDYKKQARQEYDDIFIKDMYPLYPDDLDILQ